jgi:hypothetical protein
MTITNSDAIVNQRLEATEGIVNALILEEHKKGLIKTNWIDFIKLMEAMARNSFRLYNILNLLTIIAGILIPVTINVIPSPIYSKLTGTVLGIIVSISASINQSYRFNDRWKHFRLISEELKIEGEKYLSLSGKYTLYDSYDKAFKLFMTNVENIKEAQIDSFIRKINRDDDRKEKPEDEDEPQ